VGEDTKAIGESALARDSCLVSGNLLVSGRRTSVRMEEETWACLREVARREGGTVHDLASRLYGQKKPAQTLTSAIRVYLLLYYRNMAIRANYTKAGYGPVRRPPR
jgi:predicted DNA-binding ribbon-helix-helix protein